MKKLFYLFLTISLLTCALAGCGCTPQEQTPSAEYTESTDLPSLFDDTRESPLGRFDETSAFGLLVKTNNDGMLLEMQGKVFLFHWTKTAKRHFEKLSIRPGNEVGVQFEITDGKLIANDVELVDN